MTEEELNNPIQEYFDNQNNEATFKDLFEATKENVDLRTDLTIQEIVIINKLKTNDTFIEEKLNFKLFDGFVNDYLRLKISLDRRSRGEFVDINRKERFEQNLRRMNDFSNVLEVKK